MTHTFRIGAFARHAGVTVRTLRYYDRIGLLEPSDTTDAGYRLYQPADLVRLQQILTLKTMGFSLDDIKNILTNPSYDLRASLVIQKEAVEEQISRLQTASNALSHAIEALDREDVDEIDSETLTTIIQNVAFDDSTEWVKRYYTADQWARLQERATQTTPEQHAGGQLAWSELADAFREVRNRPLGDPEVQRLAARMEALVQTFTQGDEQIEGAVREMWRDVEQMPAHIRPDDLDLYRFMRQALTHYRQTQTAKDE